MSANDTRRPPTHLYVWLLLALPVLLFACLAHAPVLQANALPFQEGAWAQALLGPGMDSPGEAEVLPVTRWSFAFDRLLGASADDLAVTHGIHIGLHAVNALLLTLLLSLLTGKRGLAVLLGMVFAAHPFSGETLALVSGRGVLLATTLGLLCLLAQVYYVRRGKPAWLAAALLFYAGALLCSIAAMPIAGFVLVLCLWPLRGRPGRTMATLALYLLPALGAGWFYARKGMLASFPREGLLEGVLLFFHQAGTGLFRYLMPVQLSPFYPAPDPVGWADFSILISCLGLLVLLGLSVYVAIRFTPSLLSGLAFFLVGTLPAWATVYRPDLLHADALHYFAVTGFYLALAGLFAAVWTKPPSGLLPSWRQVLLGMGALYLSAYGTRAAHDYLGQWSTTARLQAYMARLAPEEALVNKELARAAPLSAVEQRIQALLTALVADPNDMAVRNDLAEALINAGRSPEALRYLTEATSLGFEDARTLANVSLAQGSLGRYEVALTTAERAVEQDPEFIRAQIARAGALRNLNRNEEAVEVYRTITELDQDNLLAWEFLTFELSRMGQPAEAIEANREVIRLKPDDPEPQTNLGILLNRTRDTEGAIEVLAATVADFPTYTNALYALGYAYESNRELDKALAQYQAILNLDPEHRNAGFRFKTVTDRKKRNEEAEARRRKAEEEGRARVAAAEEHVPETEPEEPAPADRKAEEPGETDAPPAPSPPPADDADPQGPPEP